MAPRANLEGLPSAIAGFLSHCAYPASSLSEKNEVQSDQPQNRALAAQTSSSQPSV
jgi:hypothetical protein